MLTPVPPPAPGGATRAVPAAGLAIDRLEASFLEEMMKYIGPTGPRDAGSGGAGESQFQSFLTQHQAKAIAARIDLGLAPGPR